MAEVDVEVEAGEVDGDALGARLGALLDAAGHTDVELSVLLVDDARIHDLNRTWRQVDAPTDVLSFPQDGPSGGPRHLGDLVVSLETAARQATDAGHTLADELDVLLVHGLCHLLGHDHHDPDDARRMAAEEARLLGLLGPTAPVGLVERAGAHG